MTMAIQSSESIITPTIGDRIECNGQFGTIKYVGLVDGYSDTWLGIDWDDPQRGKHNGTAKGKQYFKASFPTSGSFVRPQKVNFGQPLVRAITSRYGKRDDELTAKINHQKLLKLQQEINAPFVELVGFDDVTEKQSDFKNLKVAFARMQNVSSVGMDLKELCPNIRELDISKNLISNWNTVFLVCEQLEQLEWLNLSENYLEPLDESIDYCFPAMKTLICGSMRLRWNQIVRLSKIFPNIQELRVPSNCIKSLDTPLQNNFKQLKILDLEGNEIIEWEEICKLSAIPNLEHLIIENIKLRSIRFKKCANQSLDMFENLRKLVLSNNLINDWESIGELNKLKNLEELRISRNPILETESQATRYQIIIAKLATLKSLNSAVIETGERRGAEYDYLKKYGLEWISVRNTDKQREFLERHNRYLELIEKYGSIEEDELKVTKNIVQSTLVNVIIEHQGRTINKRVPRSISIQKLIVLVQRLFKLSDKPKLLYICVSQPDIQVELDDEGKELGFYSVNDGDKIIAVT